MNRTRTLLILVAFAIAGVTATFVIQGRAKAKLRENDAVPHQQHRQLSELVAERQRLSNQLAQATSLSSEDLTAELAGLRDKAESLRKQTNELGKQLEQHRRSRPVSTTSKPVSHPPEYYEQLHRTAGAKARDALYLAGAFQMYASDHQGQFPSSLDQVDPYLRKERVPLSGTNEFEIVFRGSRHEIERIPSGAVAVIRDPQVWIAPSGKAARVYGMANSTSLIVESDDNFQSWEAEHILPSPNAGR